MAVLSTIVAFASENADLAALKSFAAGRGMSDETIFRGTIKDASEYLKISPSPDVLIVEIPSRENAAEMLDALAEVCDPNTKVITIGKINEYSFYCWLMDIGIAQYLLCPLDEHVLEAAFEKLQSSVSVGAASRPPSKLIAVMGARGGVGATSVAINLAGIISEQTQKKVALVDLDPQEGTISLALDIQPSMGLRDVLEKPDRIDSLFLDRVMSKVGKYLAILSAEERLSEQLAIHENAAQPLLDELRTKYDYIVLDVPRHMNHFTRTCLQAADHTILVTELTLLCLRDTLRMQDAMKEGWKAKPPMIVTNRVGLAAKHEIPALDFEKGTGARITDQITFAPDIFMPISRDIPALKHKSHAAVKSLYHLASLIAPIQKTPAAAAKKSTGLSFFKKKEG
jgi:pilus assembly protein CpaE